MTRGSLMAVTALLVALASGGADAQRSSGSQRFSLKMIPIAAQRAPGIIEDLRGRASEATFESGHYRQAGIAFDVPADWKYEGTVAGETPADETAHWTQPNGPAFSVLLSKRKASPESVATLLAGVIANKTKQREREEYRRWRVRPESVQHTFIGGHQAVVAIADFESKSGGRPRVERLTWIYTPESRVLFFSTMSPEQLTTFQPEFDGIVQSATLP